MSRTMLALCAGLLILSATTAGATAPAADNDSMPELVWHTEYEKAVREATEERKMLFIFFTQGSTNGASRAFEQKALSDAKIHKALQRTVLTTSPR